MLKSIVSAVVVIVAVDIIIDKYVDYKNKREYARSSNTRWYR